jgi:phosphoglucosamine mutase
MPKLVLKLRQTHHALNGRGRTLIRYSGTEMLARIMIEGEDGAVIQEMAQDIANEIHAEVGMRG